MKKIRWGYKGRAYTSEVVALCPMCKKHAVVALPAELRAEQPDETTHVCHPSAGGCNHGFALDVVTHVPGGEA